MRGSFLQTVACPALISLQRKGQASPTEVAWRHRADQETPSPLRWSKDHLPNVPRWKSLSWRALKGRDKAEALEAGVSLLFRSEITMVVIYASSWSHPAHGGHGQTPPQSHPHHADTPMWLWSLFGSFVNRRDVSQLSAFLVVITHWETCAKGRIKRWIVGCCGKNKLTAFQLHDSDAARIHVLTHKNTKRIYSSQDHIRINVTLS